VRIEDEERLVKGRVLVRAPRYPVFRYGDELRVEVKLETPPVFDDFSYRDYLARQGVHAMVGWFRSRLSHAVEAAVYCALLFVKARIQATIARILPEPEASLLTGILLGMEAGIPERVKNAFSTSGTMHAVAISGFNQRQTG
jgi:competence protein ComEC